MKDASTAILEEVGPIPAQDDEGSEPETVLRFRLWAVAQAFVDLQQARHRADYDIEEPFQPQDAAIYVAQAKLALLTWPEVRNEPLAQRYLYALLFRDRS